MRENGGMPENPYQSPRAASAPDGLSAASKSEAKEKAAGRMRRIAYPLVLAHVPIAFIVLHMLRSPHFSAAEIWGVLFGSLGGSALGIFLYWNAKGS